MDVAVVLEMKCETSTGIVERMLPCSFVQNLLPSMEEHGGATASGRAPAIMPCSAPPL
jgi:hypothetical protein